MEHHCTVDHSRKRVDPVEAVVGSGSMITLAVTVALLCGSVFGHDIIVHSPMYGHNEFWQASSSRGPLAELRALAPPVKPHTAVTPDVDSNGWTPESPTVHVVADATPPAVDELHVTLVSVAKPAAPVSESAPETKQAVPNKPAQATPAAPVQTRPAKSIEVLPAAPAIGVPRPARPAANVPVKSQRPERSTVGKSAHPIRRNAAPVPHQTRPVRPAPEHATRSAHAPKQATHLRHPAEQRVDASGPTTSRGHSGRPD